MIAPDTSVLVAGFATWHEAHQSAARALGRGVHLVAHSALETYSVLTRLPAPHRVAPAVVHEYLADIAAQLKTAGIRVDVDTSDDRFGKKIRNAQTQKVPFMLIAGEQDVAAGAV